MKSDEEYIREGVELADGWRLASDNSVRGRSVGLPPTEQPVLDALAAQLVRQVDALDGHSMEFGVDLRAFVRGPKFKAFYGHTIAQAGGDDRTMNAIKAIVDSEVLS